GAEVAAEPPLSPRHTRDGALPRVHLVPAHSAGHAHVARGRARQSLQRDHLPVCGLGDCHRGDRRAGVRAGEVAMARSNEPIAWSLFGAGGVVAALCLPITILITGIATVASWVSETGLLRLIHSPLTRLYLLVVISLCLFHAVHRTRFVLMDLGLKSIGGLV